MNPEQMMNRIDGANHAVGRPAVTSVSARYLVLSGAASDSESSSSLARLADMFRSARLRAVESLSAARRSLDEDPAATLLLAYPDPLVELARRLEHDTDGTGPDGSELALPAWVEQVLNFYRRHRRRIALVNAHAALADPQELVHQLRQRLAVTINLPAPGSNGGESPTPPNALALAVAMAVVQGDDTFGVPLAALEASSLPLPRSVRVDASALIEAWRAVLGRPETEANEGAARELAEENELLVLQLRQVQEELESYFLAERDRHSQIEHLQIANAQLTENAKQLEEDLRTLQASLSWRVTAPLRAVARPFMQKGTDG